MDAALNSLTSPGMVAATLACLGPHARLAEISKRGIWSPARVAQERPDVHYKLVAIDFLPVPVWGCHIMQCCWEASLQRMMVQAGPESAYICLLRRVSIACTLP